MMPPKDLFYWLEEMNINAWPSLRSRLLDGWILRYSGGGSRRANSVNPMSGGRLPLKDKIAQAENIYAYWGASAIFRITPLAEPLLDQVLSECGYQVEGATFVQTADARSAVAHEDVMIQDRLNTAWLEAANAVRELKPAEAQTLAAQHAAIQVPTGWALAMHDGKIAGVGAVAIERGWGGLHSIYVASSQRRRGVARRLSESLCSYAHHHGASRLWLQVAQDNTSALSLYSQLSFQTQYAYHYRWRPAQNTGSV